MVTMVTISMVTMVLQGGNEGADTDAEIERIKSEIELEQKNKQTLGGWVMIMFLIKIKIMCPRMDKHGAGEECEDDGEKRDGHGGHNLLLLLHPHHPKSHNPPHHHQLNQHSKHHCHHSHHHLHHGCQPRRETTRQTTLRQSRSTRGRSS